MSLLDYERKTKHGKNWVHIFFTIAIIGKGINAVAEIVGGLFLGFFAGEKVAWLVVALTHEELVEDPRDKIAQFLLQTVQHLSISTQLFGSWYLLSHGLIKIGLIIALLKRKMWAYPLAILVFVIFIAYQLYRFTYSQSPWLLGLSFLDVVVIVVTWLEYQRLKQLVKE